MNLETLRKPPDAQNPALGTASTCMEGPRYYCQSTSDAGPLILGDSDLPSLNMHSTNSYLQAKHVSLLLLNPHMLNAWYVRNQTAHRLRHKLLNCADSFETCSEHQCSCITTSQAQRQLYPSTTATLACCGSGGTLPSSSCIFRCLCFILRAERISSR